MFKFKASDLHCSVPLGPYCNLPKQETTFSIRSPMTRNPMYQPDCPPATQRNPMENRANIRSLLSIAHDIAATALPGPLSQRRNISALSRRATVLVVLFEELLQDASSSHSAIPTPAALCLTEILTFFRRLQKFIDNCFWTSSRVALALQYDVISDDFRERSQDLATLLDILMLSDLRLSQDVRECVSLLVAQTRRGGGGASSSSSYRDPKEEALREDILNVIADLEREVIPERARLESLFENLGLTDAATCKEEIAKLESEIRVGQPERWTATMVSALGLIQYAKCVLFGASTPRRYGHHSSAIADNNFADLSDDSDDYSPSSSSRGSLLPSDFRCPITIELMRDPVVVASGQTYEHDSIKKWIDAGHATCPKTGQPLQHLRLIPNVALRSHIAQWCRQHNIPYEPSDQLPASGVTASAPSSSSAAASSSSSSSMPAVASTSSALPSNKAALEAARMTALFLVEKLASETATTESLNRIVHELRLLAKSAPENRAFIAEAGAIPMLLPLLRSADPSLQVNAVTAILNLSILDDNKKRIMDEHEGLSSIIRVLVSGATWPARENAAAALLSLSSFHSTYRKRIGRHRKVAEGLAQLVRSGPESSKRDGLIAILNLAGARDNVGKLVEGGVVEAALTAVGHPDVGDMAVAVLASLAKRGAALQVGAAEGFVPKMISVLRNGSPLAKETAAAALVSVCHLGCLETMAEVAKTPGIEWLIWGLTASGSVRTKRKAAALGRMYRRWMAAQQMDQGIDMGTSLSVLTPAVS